MDDEIEFETAADARRRARESRGTYTRGLRLRKTRGRYCYSTTCAQLETQLQNVRHQQDQLLAEADTLRVKEQVLLQATACKANLLHSIVMLPELDTDSSSTGSTGSFLVGNPALLDQEVHMLEQVFTQPHACSSIIADSTAGLQLPYTQRCLRAALAAPGGSTRGACALAHASRARLGDVACEARQLALQMAVCMEHSDSFAAVDAAVQQAMLLFAAGRHRLLAQLYSVNLDTLELVEQAPQQQQLWVPQVVQHLGLELEQLQQLCVGHAVFAASSAALLTKLQAALPCCTEQPEEPVSPVHALAAAWGWASDDGSGVTSGHDSDGGSGASSASGHSSLARACLPMVLTGPAALEQHEAMAQLGAILGRLELLVQDVWTLVFNTLSRRQIALLFKESWPWYPEPISVCEHIASMCAQY